MNSIVIKPETMELWCEGCRAFTCQGLVHSTGEYMCPFCGTITVMEDKNDFPRP